MSSDGRHVVPTRTLASSVAVTCAAPILARAAGATRKMQPSSDRPFNVRTESGEHLEWNVIPEFEHLDAPFEIYPGVIVPAGSYKWQKYRGEMNTATKRRSVIDLTYWWGSFYDGTRKQTGLPSRSNRTRICRWRSAWIATTSTCSKDGSTRR